MAHNIWGSRFLNRDTKPAWHGIGIQTEEGMTAQQALEKVGDYQVGLQPLKATGVPGIRFGSLETDYAIIVRYPTDDSKQPVTFGAPVSKDYELIGPMEAARIWDAALVDFKGNNTPVETLGVLREGREIFISAKIDTINIRGDEVQMFQVLYNPMYSNTAAETLITGVRPVCANTLALGMSSAVSKKVILHNPGAKDEMAKWLRKMYLDNHLVIVEAKDTFTRMAMKKLTTEPTNAALRAIYPDPMSPKPEWEGQFGLTMQQHEQRFAEKLEAVAEVRKTIFDLFSGDSATMDTEAVEGTAFGLYNCVSEYEDNRRGPRVAVATGVTVGDRAAQVRRAYRVLSEVSRN